MKLKDIGGLLPEKKKLENYSIYPNEDWANGFNVGFNRALDYAEKEIEIDEEKVEQIIKEHQIPASPDDDKDILQIEWDEKLANAIAKACPIRAKGE